MPEEAKGIPTINESSPTDTKQAGGESIVPSGNGEEGGGVFKTSGGLISTAEFEPEKISEEDTKGPESKEKDDKDEAKDEKEKGKEQDEDFTDHPRFQKRITQLNNKAKSAEERAIQAEERALKLEGRLEALERGGAKPGGEKETESFQNVLDMDNEKLRESLYDNPKEFLSNFAKQVRDEVISAGSEQAQVNSAKAFEGQILKAFDKFGEENPRFVELWDAGEITKFIKDNPGHNAFSSFMVLTEKERLEKEAGRVKKEVLGQIKAKRGADVLGGSPAAVSASSKGIPPELRDTNKFGGRTNVLLNRLLSRRKAAGAG